MPVEPAKAAISRDPILVDLALQGGGSHGAFTWGVLDRLLEEPWLGIDGISGTSAGAMNAAVLVDGHAKGGAAGARTALRNFWRRVSEAARFSPIRRGPGSGQFRDDVGIEKETAVHYRSTGRLIDRLRATFGNLEDA